MHDWRDTIVIIPTLNEAENIGVLVETLVENYVGINVLVVDDDSRDKTQEIVREMEAKLPEQVGLIVRKGNPGYGRSILDGLREAHKRDFAAAITMDADLSHDYKVLPKMREALANAADFAVGSRYVQGGGIANWKWYRKLLSRFANLYVGLILGTKLADQTTGYVAYSKRAVQVLLETSPKSEGYSFLVETKYILARAGLHGAEVPIIFTDRREGQSKMSGKVIWESILRPWRLRFPGKDREAV